MDNSEPILVADKTKECPTCGKKIEAAVEECPTCGAKFEVTTRAYCTNDHKLIHIDAAGKCPDCGGAELLDPRLYSRMTVAGTPPDQPASKTEQAETAVVASIPAFIPAFIPAPDAALSEEAVPAKETAPPEDTRKCPRCAETIKAEARICRFCGARFEIAVKGYCSKDHAEVTLDGNDKCSICGGEVIDRHIASTLISEPAKAAAPPAAQRTAPGVAAMAVSTAAPTYYPPAAPLSRPGFVSFYAIVTWIWCAAVAIGGIVGGVAVMSDSVGGGLILVLFCLGYATLMGFMGAGLWNLMNWARVTMIVLRSIWTGLYALSALGLLLSGDSSNVSSAICGGIFWIGINLAVLGWFSQNGKYFPAAKPAGAYAVSQAVMHPAASAAPPQGTTSAVAKPGTRAYFEKDNLGMSQDTLSKANVYWIARTSSAKKDPFILYIFDSEADARLALLELPCIHAAQDTQRLICTEVITYGTYPTEDGHYEAILAGGDLTHQLWEQAKAAFTRHAGKMKNQQEPESRAPAAPPRKAASPDKVKYIREDRKEIHGQMMTYRIHRAPDAASAKAFLEKNPVSRKYYYLIVETPEGNYCRDIDGMYKE